ncbi:Plasma membrane proteolipid [Sphaerulina musiva]
MISTLLLVILTVLLPPVGVFCVAGCGADVIINICLTLLGYFPGHIHAFYILYIFYSRKEQQQQVSSQQGGNYPSQQNFRPAPGIYSTKVQSGGFASSSRRSGRGGRGGGYGTIAAAPPHPPN